MDTKPRIASGVLLRRGAGEDGKIGMGLGSYFKYQILASFCMPVLPALQRHNVI
jgi:hypothetical protein